MDEVGQRPGKPVDLVDDHDIDLAAVDIGEQLLQRRTLQVAARAAAIIIALRQTALALMALAGDEGLAGLALSMQRIERLLQSFLRRFAV